MGAKGQRRRQKKTARSILAAERRLAAVALRKQKKTFKEIGEAIGVSAVAAHKMVKQQLDALNARTVTETQQLRQDQLSRVHALIASLWTAALKGDLNRIDRLERLMAREARLAGLDAPKKLEHSGPGGKPIEVSELRVRVLERLKSLAATPSTEPTIQEEPDGGRPIAR